MAVYRFVATTLFYILAKIPLYGQLDIGRR